MRRNYGLSVQHDSPQLTPGSSISHTSTSSSPSPATHPDPSLSAAHLSERAPAPDHLWAKKKRLKSISASRCRVGVSLGWVGVGSARCSLAFGSFSSTRVLLPWPRPRCHYPPLSPSGKHSVHLSSSLCGVRFVSADDESVYWRRVADFP